MKYLLTISIAILLTACSTTSTRQTQIQKNNVTNITAKGSLEINQPLECVELSSITNKHTAADIFTGVSACIKNNDITRATRLYALALAYGRYDQLRMVDKSARAAIGALQYKYIVASKEVRLKLKEEINKHSAANKNGKEFISLCRDIRKLGKPDYYPSYMIRHGMAWRSLAVGHQG